MSQKKSIILIFITGLILGFIINKGWWMLHKSKSVSDIGNGAIRLNGQYELINPLLFCGVSENKEFNQYQGLKNKVQEVVDKNISNNSAEKISVYYRTLDNGRWFGINENEKYSPASMLKIPLMISYLKEAEENPELLSKEIFYDGSFDFNQMEYYKPKVRIQKGESYAIDELLEASIVYSGNNAEALLLQNLDPKIHMDVFTDLGVNLDQDETLEIMSAKSFSYFFRVLYNSSYLNKKMSQKALSLLTRARFKHGIAGGVPNDVMVAQKFGERGMNDVQNNVIWRELHDCGIVYDKKEPYHLCVMTRGKNFDDLSKVIIEISKTIYETNQTSG